MKNPSDIWTVEGNNDKSEGRYWWDEGKPHESLKCGRIRMGKLEENNTGKRNRRKS